MLSCSQDLVTVLHYGVKVSDTRAELDLHVAEEQSGGGGVDPPDISQYGHCSDL